MRSEADMAIQEAQVKFSPKKAVPEAPKEVGFDDLSPRGKTIAAAMRAQYRVGEWWAILLIISPFMIAGLHFGDH